MVEIGEHDGKSFESRSLRRVVADVQAQLVILEKLEDIVRGRECSWPEAKRELEAFLRRNLETLHASMAKGV